MAAPTAAPRRSPLRRPVAPRVPRRVSGPSTRIRRRRRSSLLQRIAALPDHRLVDRLVRGRVWIPLIGFLLIGIVFMQVSMLKLNAGIGNNVEKSSTLERIQQAASKFGMVMPAPDQVKYLKAKQK